MDPAAVVFDLDGVLVDSERAWDAARRGLAAEHRRAWPPGTTTALQGMSTPEWAAYLADHVGVPLPPERIAAAVIARMADQYRRELPLLPGAVTAVRALAGRWPLGVASSSPPDLIRTVLAAAGLADRFQTLVSSEEVPRGKPAPEVYLLAAERLGVDPTGCVAVEDSANGLRSAAAAGMTVVATPNPHFPPPPDALALAAAVVPDVAAVTPELIGSL
jgi:HAD superfamily hydrolase (TIGR01509 family)